MITRRAVLRAGLTATALAVVSGHGVSPGRAAAAEPATWSTAETPDLIGVGSVSVEGAGVSVFLRAGAAAAVLTYVARRFHYEIRALEHGIVGFRPWSTVQPGDAASAAGIALEIDPTGYPAGVAQAFFPRELDIIRDILGECDGVVAWGGDRAAAPSEGRFELVVGPDDPVLGQVVHRLTGRAGVAADPAGADPSWVFTIDRERQAESVRQHQIRSGAGSLVRTRVPSAVAGPPK